MTKCNTKTYCKFLRQLFVVYVFLTLSIGSNAATVKWTGGFLGLGSDWQTGSNWNTGNVPTAADDVVFNEVLLGYTVNVCDAGLYQNSF